MNNDKPDDADTYPLIPRALFFGEPSIRNVVISHDGQWLAWMTSNDGVANIWIADRKDRTDARQLTFEQHRAPGAPVFARDGRHLLYHKDSNGDENTHLFAIDIMSATIRDLTPISGAKCMLMSLSRKIPDEVLVRMNDRDPRFHDVWAITLADGNRRLVELNVDGHSAYVADDQYRLQIARRSHEDGSAELRKRDGRGLWADWINIPLEDVNTTSASHIDNMGTTLFLYDSRLHDTPALVAVDIGTGESRELAHDPQADVDGMILDSETYFPLAWASGAMRRRYKPLSQGLAGDIAMLDDTFTGDWTPISITTDMRFWVLSVNTDIKPAVFWLYDRVQGTVDKLFESRPKLTQATLSRTHPVRVPTRDGLEMVGYLTLPASVDVTAQDHVPRVRKPVPLVLVVHGGPATRDRFGFDPEAQWLANRGYAVLKVNYRGSAGFGKKFMAAGNLQWGLAMSDDLDDAADWAISKAITSTDGVAITGGSYGGYAVLRALTRTPTRYACGVDLVGPSNLETLIETIPPYWTSIRKAWLKSVGDPSEPGGRASLRARSPIHDAHNIVRPLLIGHGANDPRVKQAEADQMVAALKANDVPVTYALFDDEGHGFGRPVNALCFAGVEEEFLAQCLGGRAEPLGDDDATASSMRLLSQGCWRTVS